MWTITIKNSNSKLAVSVYTLNRKKIVELVDLLCPNDIEGVGKSRHILLTYITNDMKWRIPNPVQEEGRLKRRKK